MTNQVVEGARSVQVTGQDLV